MRVRSALPLCLFPWLVACHPQPAPVTPTATIEPPPLRLDQLSREELNYRAAERFLPLFWRADDNADRKIDPSELAVLWTPEHAQRGLYVGAHGFLPSFEAAYRSLLDAPDESKLTPSERERRSLVRTELRGGRPTLVETDLGDMTDEDRQMAAHVIAAASLLEQLYAKQLGTAALASQVPSEDEASRALFFRNQTPWCVTPPLDKDPGCNAIPSLPKRASGLYPAALQSDPKFCERLERAPNGPALMDHFSTVESAGAGWKAVPYHVAYADEMAAVAKELDAAAQSITSTVEAPLRAYLVAAAIAFRTNDWEPANVAWSKMAGSTTRWYLRVAPDEVYEDPCAWKAGFQLSFARLSAESKAWQDRLAPVKAEMEKALAALAGPPYRARDVAFKLPDFIDIVLNAGYARMPQGGTIGESLPNWGPTASKGSRTVVMTNLYSDNDSRQAVKRQMASLFCAATDARASTDPKAATMNTVLHEATHNLGPIHEWLVGGKRDEQVFGGPLASTLEELKAQTGALYFSEWLVDRKVISADDAIEAHLHDVAWAFGHIARGMYEADGRPKSYSQLASIQLGTLWKAGVLAWKPNEAAADATDQGCFELDFAKWKPTVETLAARVLRIKARGDRKDAEALKATFVDETDEWSELRDVIAKRWLRAPKSSFVYSIK